MVSVKRLTAFLNAGELQPEARKLIADARPKLGEEVLAIEGGEFCWSKKATGPTLEDINLNAKRGELVGVLGRVGAGKVRRLFVFNPACLTRCRRVCCRLSLAKCGVWKGR